MKDKSEVREIRGLLIGFFMCLCSVIFFILALLGKIGKEWSDPQAIIAVIAFLLISTAGLVISLNSKPKKGTSAKG